MPLSHVIQLLLAVALLAAYAAVGELIVRGWTPDRPSVELLPREAAVERLRDR